MNKSQLFSLITLVTAAANTVYGFIEGNAGLLTDFGISPKWGQLVMLIGLVGTALSSALTKSTK